MTDHANQNDAQSEHRIPSYRGGGGAVSPGKRTLTQSLAPRPVIIYRAAEPRDANHVAVGADAAVERASGSAGAPLRTDLRDRFESSLGADLSAVRVHTGGTSEEAASAVGARAYTVGNDIHFGAGQYQPDDPFGLHLLAHEVAHTQQQAGGSPHRQHKLEVSTPGDAAEQEADRAADAMVAGQAAAVGAARGGVARDASGTVAQASKSIKKGPIEVEVAVGSDGKVSVSGSFSKSQAFETGIPGVFFEVGVGAKISGEGEAGPGGAVTIGLNAELSGQGTLNGGIQQVASVYGGAAIAIKWPGLAVKRDAKTGSWSLDVSSSIALTGKLIVGAKAEITDALPPPWQGLKYEISPGGEQELAVLDLKTGKLSMGKDLKAAVAAVKQQLVAVGLMDPEAQKAKPTVAQNAATAGKAAKQQHERAKKKAETDRAQREKQIAKDKTEYDRAHNPAYANNSHEPNALEALDECNPDAYVESTQQP